LNYLDVINSGVTLLSPASGDVENEVIGREMFAHASAAIPLYPGISQSEVSAALERFHQLVEWLGLGTEISPSRNTTPALRCPARWPRLSPNSTYARRLTAKLFKERGDTSYEQIFDLLWQERQTAPAKYRRVKHLLVAVDDDIQAISSRDKR
jgi:hypothetical protein